MAVIHALRAEIPIIVSPTTDNRWRVAHDGLGIYGYGENIDAAIRQMLDSLNLISDYYLKANKIDALKARFAHAQVQLEDSVQDLPDGRPLTFRSEVRLPLHASFGKVLQNVG